MYSNMFFFYISSRYRMIFTIQEFYFEILWIWTILFHILPSTDIFLLLESKILRNSLFAANLSNTNTLQNLPREPFRLNIIGPRGFNLIFPITPIYEYNCWRKTDLNIFSLPSISLSVDSQTSSISFNIFALQEYSKGYHFYFFIKYFWCVFILWLPCIWTKGWGVSAAH